ncbi:MAG: hypothetical protein AAGA80_25855, partial [Cyanobacteria bacterium P01_F01_bin.143]
YYILTCGKWDTIKIWNRETGDCLLTLDNRPYGGTNITETRGLTAGQRANLLALGVIEDSK